MNSGYTRRDLFSLLARPFQQRIGASTAPQTAAPKAVENRVAVVQGRHCLALTSFCAVCVERCPVAGAMKVSNGMPLVDPDICNGCGLCQEICPAPTNAVLLLPRRRKPIPTRTSKPHELRA